MFSTLFFITYIAFILSFTATYILAAVIFRGNDKRFKFTVIYIFAILILVAFGVLNALVVHL